MNATLQTTQPLQTVNEAWFDEFIASVRTHQLQLETGTASQEIKQAYDLMINGSDNDLAYYSKASANRHFIRKLILDYIKSISSSMPVKLAFDMDDSEVLVWAEIADDDEAAENFLLLTEAEVNAKYHQFGYDLTSTIVETRDSLPIPNHYVTFKG